MRHRLCCLFNVLVATIFLPSITNAQLATRPLNRKSVPLNWKIVCSQDVRYVDFYEKIPIDFQVDNRKVQVWHFHRDESNFTALWHAGDLRFLSLDIDSIVDVSRSANHGWNYGAFPYFHQGNFHLVGGYGFWRKHADDIVFSVSTREWERVGDSYGMDFANDSERDWFFRLADGNIGCLQWQTTAESPHANGSIWKMPAGGGAWTKMYQVKPPAGSARIVVLYDLKDWLLIGYSNLALSLVRKSDWSVATLLSYPLFEVLRSHDPSALAIFDHRVEAWTLDTLIASLRVEEMLASISEEDWGLFVEEDALRSVAQQNGEEGTYRLPTTIIGVLSLAVILAIVYERRKKLQGMKIRQDNSINGLADDVIAALLELEDEHISIPEFDQWIRGADSMSPETVRSKRAQLFKEVNQLSRQKLGHEILIRERSPEDSRIFRYRVCRTKTGR